MIHLLIGIQGSGKTTYSKKLQQELNCEIVSSDHVRDLHKDWAEDKIWPEIYRLLSVALKENKDVIFDATSISKKVRLRHKEKLQMLGADVVWGAYFLDTPLDECIKRVTLRNESMSERFLPLEVIPSYFNSLEKPDFSEGFEFIKIIRNKEVLESFNK